MNIIKQIQNYFNPKNNIIYLGDDYYKESDNIERSRLIHSFDRFLLRRSYSSSDIPQEYRKGEFTIIYENIFYKSIFDGEGEKLRKIIRLKDSKLHSEFLPALEIISIDLNHTIHKEYRQNGILHNNRGHAICFVCLNCLKINNKVEYCTHMEISRNRYYLDGKLYEEEQWMFVMYIEFFKKIIDVDERLYRDVISIIKKY
jgi:hypothetical protein